MKPSFTYIPGGEVIDDGWHIDIPDVYIFGHVTEWLKERKPINRIIRDKDRSVYSHISGMCAAYPHIFTYNAPQKGWYPAVAVLPDGRFLAQYKSGKRITLVREWVGGSWSDGDFLFFEHTIEAEYGTTITDMQVKELIGPFLHFGALD